MELLRIPISKIKADVFHSEDGLEDSLVSVDQRYPIKVRMIDNPEYDYEIVNGRRRLKALRDIGGQDILALVERDMTDTELAVDALIGNAGTPNELDEARHILYLMEVCRFSGKQIAKMTRYSESTISTRLKLVEKLHPLLQDKLQKGEMKVSAALEATKLPQDEQCKLLEGKLTYKIIFEKVREWQSSQITNLTDDFEENEIKPGLFLTSEQMEILLEGNPIVINWMSHELVLEKVF